MTFSLYPSSPLPSPLLRDTSLAPQVLFSFSLPLFCSLRCWPTLLSLSLFPYPSSTFVKHTLYFHTPSSLPLSPSISQSSVQPLFFFSFLSFFNLAFLSFPIFTLSLLCFCHIPLCCPKHLKSYFSSGLSKLLCFFCLFFFIQNVFGSKVCFCRAPSICGHYISLSNYSWVLGVITIN